MFTIDLQKNLARGIQLLTALSCVLFLIACNASSEDSLAQLEEEEKAKISRQEAREEYSRQLAREREEREKQDLGSEKFEGGNSGGVSGPSKALDQLGGLEVREAAWIVNAFTLNELGIDPAFSIVSNATISTFKNDVPDELKDKIKNSLKFTEDGAELVADDNFNLLVMYKKKVDETTSTFGILPRQSLKVKEDEVEFELLKDTVAQAFLTNTFYTQLEEKVIKAPLISRLDQLNLDPGTWVRNIATKSRKGKLHFSGSLIQFQPQQCMVILDKDQQPPFELFQITGGSADFLYSALDDDLYYAKFICRDRNFETTDFSGWSNGISAKGNLPPSLPNFDTLKAKEGKIITLQINGTDPEGRSLTYACISPCPEGLSVDSDSGELSWTPTYLQSGDYTFWIEASDGELQVRNPISIEVENTDLIPSPVAIDELSAFATTAISFQIRISNPDEDEISFACSQNCPGNLSIDSSSGQVDWIPSQSQAGEQTITFAVSDGKNSVDVPIDFSIYPTIDLEPIIAVENQQITNQLNSQHNASHNLVYSCLLNCTSGLEVVETDGGLSWKPKYDQSGSWNITFRVSKGNISDEKTVNFNIVDVPSERILDLPNDYAGVDLFSVSNIHIVEDQLYAFDSNDGLIPSRMIGDTLSADNAGILDEVTGVLDSFRLGSYLYALTIQPASPIVSIDTRFARRPTVSATLLGFSGGEVATAWVYESEENLAYVAAGKKLYLADLSDPTNLQHVGTPLELANNLLDIERVEDTLYLLTDTGKVEIISIENPLTPSIISGTEEFYTNDLSIQTNGKAIIGIAPVLPQVTLYDAQNLEHSYSISGSYRYSGSVKDWNKAIFQDPFLYSFKNNSNEFFVLNLQDISSPVLAAEVETSAPNNGIKISGDTLYTYGPSGMSLFKKVPGTEKPCEGSMALQLTQDEDKLSINSASLIASLTDEFSMLVSFYWTEETSDFNTDHGAAAQEANLIYQQDRFHLKHNSTNQKIVLNIETSTGQISLESNASILSHQWFWILVTIDTSQARIYINGQLDNSETVNEALNTSTDEIELGSALPGKVAPPIRMQHLAFWNKALGADEVEQLLQDSYGYLDLQTNASNYVSSEDLLAWFPLESETASKFADQVANFQADFTTSTDPSFVCRRKN